MFPLLILAAFVAYSCVLVALAYVWASKGIRLSRNTADAHPTSTTDAVVAAAPAPNADDAAIREFAEHLEKATFSTVLMVSEVKQDVMTVLFITGMLPEQRNCLKCGSTMRLGDFKGSHDGKVWRCSLKACRTTRSIRDGTIFSESKLTLADWVRFLYLWSWDVSRAVMENELNLSRSTHCCVAHYYMELSSNPPYLNRWPKSHRGS